MTGTGRKLPVFAVKDVYVIPDDVCPDCWRNKVAALKDGPTCPHNKFDWDRHLARLREIIERETGTA